MCGRYSQAADMLALAKRFRAELAEILEIRPRYNLAPSEEAAAIVLEGGKKRIEMMKWGITRQWGKDKPPIFVINLRAEKLVTGPFRSVLAGRRCLIPADGFYEWKPTGKPKQPFRFTMKDESLFAMPAIYDDPTPETISPTHRRADTPIRTFCIFTVDPNPLVAKIHNRMPAILPPGLEDAWLDPELTNISKIVALLRPYPANQMKSYEVTPVLNSAKFDSAELIKPIH